MTRHKNSKREDKSKGGRPKGSKTKARLPIKSLKETFEIVKNIQEKSKGKVLPLETFGSFVDFNSAQSRRILGTLQSEYNIFNKEPNNLYTLSDFGKRVASGDYNAIKEMFSKNPILLDLFNQFGNVDIGKEGIEFYLKKEYKAGAKKEQIIERFLNDKSFLESMRTTRVEPSKECSLDPTKDAFKAIRIIDFFLPLKETQNEKTAANTLYEIAKRNNWQSLFWLLEGLKNQPEGSIKESANKIAEAFEKDVGIKISEKGIENSSEEKKKSNEYACPYSPSKKKKDKGESVEGDLTGNQD